MGLTVLQVALGGALGAVLRYLAGLGAARVLPAFPAGTLAVNVVGSFLMGLAFVWLITRGDGRLAPLIMTGILGGFTTFSAFSLDVLTLVEKGRAMAAGGYVLGSVGLSLAAIWAGVMVARAL